ncbi:MAG TPA: SDR family oxidoreductase [Pseudoxanthomonas sp.]|nr:SDR family oxidoreductase [Pseudoxanthomonas sp.]
MNQEHPSSQPAQVQERQPGHQQPMHPDPQTIRDDYRGSDKLAGKVALITGGDSGIGRAVAVHFAREGADIAIAYLDEHDDARETERLVQEAGRRCISLPGDLGDIETCRRTVEATVEQLGGLDILVNNAAEQHPVDSPEDLLDSDQIERTFRTNAFAYLYLMSLALPHLREGGSIINTSSVTGVRGHKQLLDYSATKGAILAMTFSFAQAVAERGIRVNAVAPGPIWTPLIPATFPAEKVEKFGQDTLLKRAGQPSEVAPAYVFLASEDASYITGQTIHINGGGYISA